MENCTVIYIPVHIPTLDRMIDNLTLTLDEMDKRVLFPARVCNTSPDKDQTVDTNNNMPMRTDDSTVELREAGTPGKFDTHLTHPDTRRKCESLSAKSSRRPVPAKPLAKPVT